MINEQILRLDTSWIVEALERKVIKMLDKNHWQEKPCWQTKNKVAECNSKLNQNEGFQIRIRSLLSIYMCLNRFSKQVSLRILSYLLANVFPAEVPSEI